MPNDADVCERFGDQECAHVPTDFVRLLTVQQSDQVTRIGQVLFDALRSLGTEEA